MARTSPRVHARGFTLIEIMVVLVLIGIITSFAVLSIGGTAEREVEQEARRFAALVELASEEAVFKSSEMGVLFRPEGYQFVVLGIDSAWHPLDEDVFRRRNLPAGMSLALAIEGLPVKLGATDDRAGSDSERTGPHVYLFSSGERMPFDVDIGVVDGPRFRVEIPTIGAATVTNFRDANSGQGRAR